MTAHEHASGRPRRWVLIGDRARRPTIARLYRYPIKGLSAEPLRTLTLTPGAGVPGDRIIAFARPGTAFDEEHPEPLPKTRFFMLQKDEDLARIRATYHADSGLVRLEIDGDEIEAEVGEDHGRRLLEDFLQKHLPGSPSERPRLVRALDYHRFTDAGPSGPEMMRAVSVINLASLRDLEERIGTTVHPLRFRANIYIDGVPPWDELDWPGSDITLGQVTARVLATTPRCAATMVNPLTGKRDIHMLKELAANYGHINCGVYVSVKSAGTVQVGEALGTPPNSEKG